jgi:hypothetical protein
MKSKTPTGLTRATGQGLGTKLQLGILHSAAFATKTPRAAIGGGA